MACCARKMHTLIIITYIIYNVIIIMHTLQIMNYLYNMAPNYVII
jgi:hypothetical protein